MVGLKWIGGFTVVASLAATGCPERHDDDDRHRGDERRVYVEPAPPPPPPPQRVVIVQQPPPDRVIVVREAPPPLIVDRRPPRPGPSQVWVNGYWVRGHSGWVWVSGRWEAPPRGRGKWDEPRWERHGKEYRFHEGHWH